VQIVVALLGKVVRLLYHFVLSLVFLFLQLLSENSITKLKIFFLEIEFKTFLG